MLCRTGLFGPVGQTPANEKGKRRKPVALCIYGFLSGFLYGWIMNLYYIIGWVRPFSLKAAGAAYVSSFFFDLSHGICTALVLWLVGETWVRKLLRIRKKFGLTGEVRRYKLPPSFRAMEGDTPMSSNRNQKSAEALSGGQQQRPCSGWRGSEYPGRGIRLYQRTKRFRKIHALKSSGRTGESLLTEK